MALKDISDDDFDLLRRALSAWVDRCHGDAEGIAAAELLNVLHREGECRAAKKRPDPSWEAYEATCRTGLFLRGRNTREQC